MERSTWPLMMLRRFESWEEELSLWIHRLYSTGIPDFFITNREVFGFIDFFMYGGIFRWGPGFSGGPNHRKIITGIQILVPLTNQSL